MLLEVKVRVTHRALEKVTGDVVISVCPSDGDRRLPPILRTHARNRASRLIYWEEDAISWLEARDLKVPRILVACRAPARERDDFLDGGALGPFEASAAWAHETRALGAALERACHSSGIRRAVIPVECVTGDICDLVEGMMLRAYRAKGFRPGVPASELKEIHVICSREQVKQVSERLQHRLVVTRAMNRARALCDLPSNIADPDRLADLLVDWGDEVGLGTRIIDVDEAREMGMNLFCAVSRGGSVDGRIVVLEHDPPGEPGAPRLPLLGLVGKGVTHDLGGYNLKTGLALHRLTYDKAGGLAVAGAMAAIAELDVQAHVIAAIPLVENSLDRAAIKPGDIVSAMDETSVYIDNTDAEGRLILADCLCWLAEFEPDAVIDIATLTGGVSVALGEPFAGVFSNHGGLMRILYRSGIESDDRVWPLPIHELHERELGHYKAEIRNSNSAHSQGAASIAAAFLRSFVTYPWAPIDMGGKGSWESPREYLGEGATGFGCRLIVEATERIAAGGLRGKKSPTALEQL